MADRTLEILAQVRDMASGHLRRIGAEGKAAGAAVRQGLGDGDKASGRLGDSVLKAGERFQGLRKVAGGALAGVGAGMAAAQAGSENFGQSVLRMGLSLSTGFAAGGPLGLALTGAGILIGRMVGGGQEAEEQARKVAQANEDWAASIRKITSAYEEQGAQSRASVTARATGGDEGAIFARWRDARERKALEQGTPDMPGLADQQAKQAQAFAALWREVEDQVKAATSGIVDGLRANTIGDTLQRRTVFGGGADAAPGALEAGDPVAAARALTSHDTGSDEQAKVKKALDEYEAAMGRVAQVKGAIKALDDAAAARERDLADLKKREADALRQSLVEQSDAMGKRLTMSEEDARYAKEAAMAAALRAKGMEAQAQWLEDQVKAAKALDAAKDEAKEAQQEEQKTQALVAQAEQTERRLRLSKEDQAIAGELLMIEDLRLRGEKERADTLEGIVRQRQAEAKAEADGVKAKAAQARDSADVAAAERALIQDKWERERQGARDRAKQDVAGGRSPAAVAKVLALELRAIDQEQAKAKADVNKEAERELSLLKSATEYDRDRLKAQHEYLDALEAGVNARTAELTLAERLADVAKREADDTAKAAKERTRREFGKDKHGREIKPFNEVGAEAETRRDRDARMRKALGKDPVVRMFGSDGPTEAEWNARKAASKPAAAPPPAGAAGGAVAQQAAKVQQAVEQAAGKIPDMATLPDPTPFVKKAGTELGKVAPAFERFTAAQSAFADATKAAVDAVGAAAAKAVERVGTDVRDLKARVRKVEDRLAAAGRGGT